MRIVFSVMLSVVRSFNGGVSSFEGSMMGYNNLAAYSSLLEDRVFLFGTIENSPRKTSKGPRN